MTIKINYIKHTCFEDRFNLDGFSDSTGIRCHSKITALIMKLLGRATEKAKVISNGKEKIIYINKKSLLNWCKNHKVPLDNNVNAWEFLVRKSLKIDKIEAPARTLEDTKLNQKEEVNKDNLLPQITPESNKLLLPKGTFDEKLASLKKVTTSPRAPWIETVIDLSDFSSKGIEISEASFQRFKKNDHLAKLQDILYADSSPLILSMLAEIFSSEENHEPNIEALHNKLFG